MNFIDPANKLIQKALNIHFDELFISILDRIESLDPPSDRFFELFINDDLELILKGKPHNILKKHQELEGFLKIAKIKTDIEKVFNYTDWFSKKKVTKYCAYDLANNLNINTCTYCNRLYTKTVIKSKSKLTRPQFDHWFPKEDFPLLALSFFNLIPSCSICNTSIKGRQNMRLDSHLHPYINEGTNIKFSFDLKSYNKFNFKVKGLSNIKVNNTIEFFKIQEIYETHLDEIEDLVLLKQKYSTNYLNNLRKIMAGAPISDDEIYRLAFSTYKIEKNFEKRPLSRMKRDLLQELRII